MYRTILTAAAVLPLARGDYSYSYDAPTMAPTTRTMTPTATFAPSRTETYAPSRVTEAPSYAPTTDTYAPTLGAYTTYLIVLLERANLVAVFDATDVAAPRLTQLLPAGNMPESAACHDDFFVVANQLDDGDRSQDRSALTIYRYEEAEPTFPWLESVDDDQGVPIPFASLSSLAAGPGTTLYSAEDGRFDKNRIFTIDVATQPAQLTEAVRIVDTNGVFRTALSYSYDYDYQLDVDDFINGDDTVNIDPEGLAYDSANNRFVVASEGSGNYYNEDIDRLNWLFQVSLRPLEIW